MSPRWERSCLRKRPAIRFCHSRLRRGSLGKRRRVGMVFRRRSHLRERAWTSRGRFTFRQMLLTKCSKRSAMNYKALSTKSISKAKNGGRPCPKLPLPLGEGWGGGRIGRTTPPQSLVPLHPRGEKRERVFAICVLHYALALLETR